MNRRLQFNILAAAVAIHLFVAARILHFQQLAHKDIDSDIDMMVDVRTAGITDQQATSNTSMIPTFVMLCGNGETNAVKEMLPLLKSMIILASEPFRLVFITDVQGSRDIETQIIPTLQQKETMVQHVDIQIVTSFQDAEEYAARIELDLHNSHHSGAWGMMKLLSPWMLKDYDRYVIVDTDMIFVQDPILLWNEFDELQSPYSMPLHAFDHESRICSCVALIKADEVRKLPIYPSTFQKVLQSHPTWMHSETRKYRPPHGDQGVYYAMAKKNATLISSLGDKWNRAKCDNYRSAFSNVKGGRKDGETGMLHRNCFQEGQKDQASLFFDFFRQYPFRWMPSKERIKENDEGNASAKYFSYRMTNSSWLPLEE